MSVRWSWWMVCLTACSATVENTNHAAPDTGVVMLPSPTDAAVQARSAADGGMVSLDAGGDQVGESPDAAAMPPIFCDHATTVGQSIVVPCVTKINLYKFWGRPPPGGSGCNDGYRYSVSLTTNEVSWSKCLFDEADLTVKWHPVTGSVVLTDAELADLVKELQAMTVSSATTCGTADHFEIAGITTRTGTVEYANPNTMCDGPDGFADHIDAAITRMDMFVP